MVAGFRDVIVHGCLGVDLGAVWLDVEQDLPPLTEPANAWLRTSALQADPIGGIAVEPTTAPGRDRVFPGVAAS